MTSKRIAIHASEYGARREVLLSGKFFVTGDIVTEATRQHERISADREAHIALRRFSFVERAKGRINAAEETPAFRDLDVAIY